MTMEEAQPTMMALDKDQTVNSELIMACMESKVSLATQIKGTFKSRPLAIRINTPSKPSASSSSRTNLAPKARSSRKAFYNRKEMLQLSPCTTRASMMMTTTTKTLWLKIGRALAKLSAVVEVELGVEDKRSKRTPIIERLLILICRELPLISSPPPRRATTSLKRDRNLRDSRCLQKRLQRGLRCQETN